MPTPRSTSKTRTATAARNDVIKMLKDDHRRVKQAFKQFEQLDPERDAEACMALVERTCGELTVHATLEEELLYPTARDHLKESDLVDEAEVEHMTAKSLIAQLQRMTADDDKYAATFKVLGEYVQHHVKEEETQMFPQLTRSKELDWPGLCDEMTSRRMELMEQLMPEVAAEADTDAQRDSPRAGSAPGRAGATQAGGRSATRGGEGRAAARESQEDDDES